MDMTIAVYKIQNKINDKPYVGKSKDVEKRWKRHIYRLNKGNHDNDHLQCSWNIYGEDAFSFEIIKECEPEYLDELEIFYIAFYDSYNNGYNLTLGGEGVSGGPLTEEHKKKLSEAMSGDKNPNYGNPLSPEHKKKISESNKGKKLSPEHKKNIGEAIKGKYNGNNHPNNKYSLWKVEKCHYHKKNMFQGNRDGSTPCKCFMTKYNGKDIPIGMNLDFTSCELIYDLIDEEVKKWI